jgi:IS4 transposase
MGDSKTFSLESIRREMMSNLTKKISKSAFWERLEGNRLKKSLEAILVELMTAFSSHLLMGKDLLVLLKVDAIWTVDSSIIRLGKEAKKNFPGTGTGSKAAIKWHACFDILNGVMVWFQLSPGTTNDSQCFPNLTQLKNKLVIFDLGYYSYSLLLAIDNAGGFFLSRLKANASVTIKAVISGLPKKAVGESLLSINFTRGQEDPIIEAIIKKEISKEKTVQCRAIGFWNPSKKMYHWYLTNLVVSAHLIYPLYRLRWQIELIFKACKNSLNANQITSTNRRIIRNLLHASIISYLSTHTLLSNSIIYLNEQQQQAISFQRVCKIAVTLAQDFKLFLLNSSKKYLHSLLEKIKLFSDEIFDPNYRSRKTSRGRIYEMLNI